MCEQQVADDMIVQCHFANIEEKQARIEGLRREIEADHREIKKLIRNGATSGDRVTDLIYLMGFDIGQCVTLHSTLGSFSAALLQHANEFIIVERIEQIETFRGGPDQASPVPAEERKTYISGIISPADTFPFTVDSALAANEAPRVLLRVSHANEIELPLGLIVQFNQCIDSGYRYFIHTDEREPASISCLGNQQIRFWIGNDAVAHCLRQRRISERDHAEDIARTIRQLIDTYPLQLAEDSSLAKELTTP